MSLPTAGGPPAFPRRGRRGGPPVKICGITSAADAQLAHELGADYLGLNFYAKSPRYVDEQRAREIRQRLPEATLVGVFVNESQAKVAALRDKVHLDLIQFHGDEGPDEVAPFAPYVLKVVRPRGPLDERSFVGYEEVWGFLFDAAHSSLYGGSGTSWDYRVVFSCLTAGWVKPERPLFLAGGLRPETVSTLASELPQGFALDVCSGVESRPGVKDRTRLDRFFLEISHGQNCSIA